MVLEYRSREGQEEIEGLLTHKQLKQVCHQIFQGADEEILLVT